MVQKREQMGSTKSIQDGDASSIEGKMQVMEEDIMVESGNGT